MNKKNKGFTIIFVTVEGDAEKVLKELIQETINGVLLKYGACVQKKT